MPIKRIIVELSEKKVKFFILISKSVLNKIKTRTAAKQKIYYLSTADVADSSLLHPSHFQTFIHLLALAHASNSNQISKRQTGQRKRNVGHTPPHIHTRLTHIYAYVYLCVFVCHC